jgi:hypothetical protein
MNVGNPWKSCRTRSGMAKKRAMSMSGGMRKDDRPAHLAQTWPHRCHAFGRSGSEWQRFGATQAMLDVCRGDLAVERTWHPVSY